MSNTLLPIIAYEAVTFPVAGIFSAPPDAPVLERLLRSIPDKSGIAYVIAQPPLDVSRGGVALHYDPSILHLPVINVADSFHPKADHIYILPPGTLLQSTRMRTEEIMAAEREPGARPADLFFSSLAFAYQNYAVGIMLNGIGTEAVSGFKTIKSQGGITIAVDNISMPKGISQSAARSGAVDFILPAEAIPRRLMEINQPFHSPDLAAELGEEPSNSDEEILRQILTLLRLKKNVDFTYYKQTTIKRRIIRRMALNKITQPAEYLAYLRAHKSEQDVLYSDMLISVTGFFRDPKSFDLLCNKVMPELIRHKSPQDVLRIWVAGCATGEEAYSISICLHGYLREHAPGLKLQIFATDISDKAVNKARIGIYEKGDLDGLSPAQVEEFFIKTDGHYQVKKIIRDTCVFALHNLLKDPPFARMDLISCRNVLIYMDPVLQKKAFQTFHYALNEHGILMLGKSETPGLHAAALFNRINNHERIYSKKGGTGRTMHLSQPHSESVFVQKNKQDQQGKELSDFQKTADDLVLARFAPPGVIVNEQFDIVQFRGSTGDWLEPSPGKASFNLLKMAREGLSFELRNILHKVKQTGAPARKEHVLISSNGLQRQVNLEALPLQHTSEPYYLVLFQQVSEGQERPQVADAEDDQDFRTLRIMQLEKELTLAREDMRSITEEQEAANEELQSANEELLSSSEELRSLNEELETSQEELQSTNEELNMLNHELLDRNEQLNNARFYLEAILDTVKDPLLILDKDLKVRSVTKGFYQKFKTDETETEGKYFYELKSCPWNSPELVNKLEQTLLTKAPFSDFELSCDFPAIGERIMLINARSLDRINDEQLIIVSLEDVTLSRKEKNELKASNKLLEERIKLAVEATGMGTWDFDPLTEIILFDDQCRRLFGFPPHEPVNYESFRNAIFPEDRKLRDKVLRDALNGLNQGNYEIEYRINVKGDTRWIKSKGRAFFTSSGQAYRLVGTMLDITRERVAGLLLRESEERFRLAADAAIALIWMSGANGQCNYFNKSWLEFTGKTMNQETGDGWLLEVYPDDLQHYLETYLRHFEQREKFHTEFRLRRHDGQYRWISAAGSPRFSPDGHFEGYIGICTDIHEQKSSTDKLEELVQERTLSLRNAMADLEASNQNLEEFAYVASHDLQEPLRKIQTFASFLERTAQEQIGEDTRLYLLKIKDASRRMGQLIEDILSYSRLRNTEDAFTNTDLNEVLQQVITDFDLKITEKQASIQVEPLPVVRAVQLRMCQLFQNLVSNAIKFSKPGVPPVISIFARTMTADEISAYPTLSKHLGYTMISVRDNGIGFDQEFAEKIFVIFQRLNGRSEFEGTGIGLAICRKIVLNHHGLIFAFSVKDKGTTFNIILPLGEQNSGS